MTNKVNEIIVAALSAEKLKAQERLAAVVKVVEKDYHTEILKAYDLLNTVTELDQMAKLLKKIKRLEKAIQDQSKLIQDGEILQEMFDLKALISDINLELQYRQQYHSQ